MDINYNLAKLKSTLHSVVRVEMSMQIPKVMCTAPEGVDKCKTYPYLTNSMSSFTYGLVTSLYYSKNSIPRKNHSHDNDNQTIT